MPKYIERPEASADNAKDIKFPYGITSAGVVKAVNDVYAYLHALNRASIEHGYDRLEDLMQPAGFSGLLSNAFVRSIEKQFRNAKPGLVMNQLWGGRPDLVPRAHFEGDRILRGDEGIEVKVSRYGKGWQGHNAETGWICIVQVAIDNQTTPVYDRAPTIVERVMLANLAETDWTFSGRREGSRRTPTASINRTGYAKLVAGMVYQRGGAPELEEPAAPVRKKVVRKMILKPRKPRA